MEIKLNITQIKYFLILSQNKSVSRTALELYVSPSTVSKNIHKLENELHTKLIKTNSHGIQLTKEGKFFSVKAKKIYEELKETQYELKNKNFNIEKPIQIAFTGSLFEIEFLSNFLKTLPKNEQSRIKLNIFDPDDGNEIASRLINHEYDIVLYQKDFFVNKKDIIFRTIFSTGLSVAISKENPLCKKKKLNIEDIIDQNVYIWDSTPSLPLIDYFKFNLAVKYPNFSFKNINDEIILEILCSTNQCIGIVPSILYDRVNEQLNFVILNTDVLFENGIAYRSDYLKSEFAKKITQKLINAELTERKKWLNKKDNI